MWLTLRRSVEAASDFSTRHGLVDASEESQRTQALFDVHMAISNAYSKLPEKAFEDASIGLLLNLLHRNFEQGEGAIAAVLTGCDASAEVVARATIESALAIRYILAGDRDTRMAAYLHSYLAETRRQTRQWRESIERAELDGSEREVILAAAAQRAASDDVIARIIDEVFDIPGETWPKRILDRFVSIGEEETYRTFYAKMSSETHGDAEETIRFYYSRTRDAPGLLERMEEETRQTTRLYVYVAVQWYLEAALAFAMAYQLRDAERIIQPHLTRIRRTILETAKRSFSV